MLVDCHVALDETRFPVERAVEILDAAKVPRALVFADARADDLDRQNQYVLDSAQQHGLYPFFYIGGNPYTDTRPDNLTVPDRLEDYAGIRWHRWVGEGIDRSGVLDNDELDWAINLMESADFEAFAAAAAHYSLPVIFEESLAVTIEFALRYPSLDIIIPHLGARSGGESKVLRALWDAPNVYFDTSLSQLDETALSRLGVERILYGSGLPEGDPELEIEKIERLPVPDEVKESIYGDNVLTLLEHYPID